MKGNKTMKFAIAMFCFMPYICAGVLMLVGINPKQAILLVSLEWALLTPIIMGLVIFASYQLGKDSVS